MNWQPIVVVTVVAVYWASAVLKGILFRADTGKRVRLWPKNRAERVIIIFWAIDIGVWLAQPLLVMALPEFAPLRPMWIVPEAEYAGAALAGVGLTFSWVCWWQMGSAWNIGTSDKANSTLVTDGMFGIVRHPIYAAQGWVLLGTALVLPTPVSAVLLAVHGYLLYAKSSIEEAHMTSIHGDAYARYRGQVGRFLPRLFARSA